MDDKTQVVKHLEMIQGVINRLAHDSFLVKGWSMTLLAAVIIFLARGENHSDYLILIFLIPVFGFWLLDGYFLSKERSFRKIYDEVRRQEATYFSMEMTESRRCGLPELIRAMCSRTLLISYVLIEATLILSTFYISRHIGG